MKIFIILILLLCLYLLFKKKKKEGFNDTEAEFLTKLNEIESELNLLDAEFINFYKAFSGYSNFDLSSFYKPNRHKIASNIDSFNAATNYNNSYKWIEKVLNSLKNEFINTEIAIPTNNFSPPNNRLSYTDFHRIPIEPTSRNDGIEDYITTRSANSTSANSRSVNSTLANSTLANSMPSTSSLINNATSYTNQLSNNPTYYTDQLSNNPTSYTSSITSNF